MQKPLINGTKAYATLDRQMFGHPGSPQEVPNQKMYLRQFNTQEGHRKSITNQNTIERARWASDVNTHTDEFIMNQDLNMTNAQVESDNSQLGP